MTPSRTAQEENFPVASWILPRRLRRHIMLFYAFARAADDIADAPALPPLQKVATLNRMEAALKFGSTCRDGPEAKARALASSLGETGVPLAHAADLLVAFRRDCMKNRYRDWPDLMRYCGYSAAPVGRYLLDLHGESINCHEPSDALCASLQVLNHIQDCRSDYRSLGRVYLPLDWIAEAGATTGDLDATQASPAIRRVLDRCLDGCAVLNHRANRLPRLINNHRLRLEAAVIIAIAHRLCAQLRRRDPLEHRVELHTGDRLLCLATGLRRLCR